MRVLAALSGGVDSAVAAARAVAAGHDVTAVHLALSSTPEAVRSGARGCCSLEDSRDARRIADHLGIPYYVWDIADRFRDDVIDDFIAEYAAGRTPNPCLRCNERIKFSAVLDRALAMGFDAVCTGHYARIARPEGQPAQLHRAIDAAKDQSYVLAVLTQEQIRHSMFPLGDSTKDQVRAEAAGLGLQVAAKPDSHDICFISDGDTAGFLRRALGTTPGDIVDAMSGDVVGSHEGAYAFTIGQRRGVGVSGPTDDGLPRYVVGIDTTRNTVMVGSPTLLDVTRIEAGAPTWSSGPLDLPQRVDVQVRAHGEPVPATLEQTEGGIAAVLDAPLRGVAPGQALVAYADTQVLASATITRTRRP